METKVSIITVCYNSEKTIERTIQSVLNQTYSNIEYIVIDGASTDGTLAIIDRYRNTFGDRMILISEKDNGIYYAMNKGIALATGEIVGIINSDDYYENDAIEKIVKQFKLLKKEYVVIHGLTYAYNNNELKLIARMRPDKLEEEMGSHPACFVSKETYECFGTFNTKYSCVADHDLMLRLFKTNKVTFVFIDEHIANAELGGMSSSTKAYVDALKFQYDNHRISFLRMKLETTKALIANFFISHGYKPIRLRRHL